MTSPRGRAPLRSVSRRWDRATADLDPPFAVVDLDAFDANLDDLLARAAGLPIRLATKSLRCRALVERAVDRPGVTGLMCYALREALWHVELGTGDDVLVATRPSTAPRCAPSPPTSARGRR